MNISKRGISIIVAGLTAGLAALNADAGTVGYWRFEEGVGQDAANEEVATLDLTLQRGTSQSAFADSAWTTDGFIGNALAYGPGTITSITTGDQSSPNGAANAGALVSTTFSVEAFFNLDTLPSGVNSGFTADQPFNIVQLRDQSGLEQNYQLRVRNNGSSTTLDFIYKTDAGPMFELRHTTELQASNWYYVGVTRDAGNTVNFYIGDAQNDLGGSLDLVTSIDSNPPEQADITDPRLIIGADLKSIGFQRSFDGVIDEVRISDTALLEQDLLFNTIGTSGLVGDLDGDGFVGINDLNIVLGNWNQNVPPGDPLADPSGDGFVGIDDLNTVLGNWNAGTPPTAVAVPEPATTTLLSLASAALLRRARRARRA